jgi:hypothetical protein
MWLPDRLYEALPLIYASAGLWTVYNFETLLGYTSGVILLITACLIWIMRRDYRSGKAPQKRMKS